jgi:hypothetical protein
MDITSCEKTPLLEAHWLRRVFEGYGLQPVFAGYGLPLFFEGYGLPRRSEHQPVRNSLKTRPALAAEGNDPDVYPGPGPDPGPEPNPVSTPSAPRSRPRPPARSTAHARAGLLTDHFSYRQPIVTIS